MKIEVINGDFVRSQRGLSWTPAEPVRDLPLRGGHGWEAGGCGSMLRARVPELGGKLTNLSFAGIFVLPDARSVSISVLLYEGGAVRHSLEMKVDRHFSNADELDPVYRLNGDGTSVETVGQVKTVKGLARVDLLSVDVPPDLNVTDVALRQNSSGSSVVVFDLLFEYEMIPMCPFRSRSGGVSLTELGAVVRLGDRPKFSLALKQLMSAISSASDLDEARGQILTFLAVICAAVLEIGAPREIHRLQLDAARELDTLDTAEELSQAALRYIKFLTGSLLDEERSPMEGAINKALMVIDRYFAKELTDEQVADQLSLSTSHFRFLFKQVTGQPFHKYLINLRLEKARQMLQQLDLSVTEISHTVGFASPAHFSRAFQKRFSIAPSALRQARR